jgi:PAS domain S-box-containing protein
VTEDDRVGVCLLDAAGNVIDLDDEFASLLELPIAGAGAGSVMGRPFAELLADAPPLPEVGTTQARRVFGEAIVELTCRGRVAPPGYTVLARQVSSFAYALVSIRRHLDLILEASPLAILCLDNNKTVTMWSGAAERMFGWTRAEVLGKPYPLVPTEQLENFSQLWDNAMATGEGFTAVEAQRQRKDGSRIDLRMHTALVHDDAGVVTGSIALLEDLTDTRRLEQRVQQSQKLEALGSLAGGIAHEFNNLLAVTIGMGELLDLDQTLSVAARGRVAEIQRVTQAARELVAQLMIFSRRSVARPSVFDINERVGSGATMIRHMLEDSIELVVTLDDQPMPVHLDPTQFDQLLLNLALNAVEAMPAGGRLSCTTSLTQLAVNTTQPGLASTEWFVCLAVRDTGTGIRAELLPHLFDPFVATRLSGIGAGLGLANVHAVATQNGGHVEVETREGEGSCFSVFLPLAHARQAEQARQARPALPQTQANATPGGHERVLLVEDDAGVRRSTAKLLEVLGYTVAVAEDGIEALALIEEGLDVELVLTDVSMPRLGGADLAKQLYRCAPELPILFMSGNLDVAELREQAEQGRVSFLQKPATLQQLAIAAREILDDVR